MFRKWVTALRLAYLFRKLKRAVRDGNVREVQRLVAAGVDVRRECDYCLRSALEPIRWRKMCSSQELHLAMVRCLIAAGAGIHMAGAPSARRAIVSNLSLLKYLVANGQHTKNTIGAPTKNVDCWLCTAITCGRIDAVRYLLKLHREDIGEIYDLLGRASLMYVLVEFPNDKQLIFITMIYLTMRLNYLRAGRASPRFRGLSSFLRILKLFHRSRPRWVARAACAAYFWWVPRCYGRGRRAGARMARRNLAAFRRLCAN